MASASPTRIELLRPLYERLAAVNTRLARFDTVQAVRCDDQASDSSILIPAR